MSETEKIYSQKIDPNRKRWDSLILIFKLISMLYIVLMNKNKRLYKKESINHPAKFTWLMTRHWHRKNWFTDI